MKNFDHNSGEYFSIGDARIYYETTGTENCPVLLLLHGGFGNIEDFNIILPDLKHRFKIIGIDSRGQGKSTIGSKTLTYELIQKDIESILAHPKVDTLSIIGFSDGGIIAYRLASLTSLRIEKLITIGAEWNFKNTESIREIFVNITGESWRKKFPSTYDAYQKLNPEPDFDFIADSIVKMWIDPNSSGYPNEAVKNIVCPLLIVRGDNDPFISRESAVETCMVVKNSSLLNIPFAGHVAFEDHKEIFMNSLNEFFLRRQGCPVVLPAKYLRK